MPTTSITFCLANRCAAVRGLPSAYAYSYRCYRCCSGVRTIHEHIIFSFTSAPTAVDYRWGNGYSQTRATRAAIKIICRYIFAPTPHPPPPTLRPLLTGRTTYRIYMINWCIPCKTVRFIPLKDLQFPRTLSVSPPIPPPPPPPLPLVQTHAPTS